MRRSGGFGHWRAQRLSALLLLPLGAWCAFALPRVAGAERGAVLAWIGKPTTAPLLLLLLAAGLLHAQQGIAVVAEDYIEDAARRAVVLRASRLVLTALGLAGAVAVLSVALGQGR